MSDYIIPAFLFLSIFVIVILSLKLWKRRRPDEYLKRIEDTSHLILTEFSKIYEKLGALDHESKNILRLSQSFYDVLKPTKTRGILGESILEELLREVLPQEMFSRQYSFRNGKKVDFVIKFPQGIVPIDAKFSLEVLNNYLKADASERGRFKKLFVDSVKKRIDETAEYIFPDEGTVDFALMYLPSEAALYHVITETELLNYAIVRKVFIVGPNTFYAYLKTILTGLSALRIEKKAKEIYADFQRLNKEVKNILQDYSVLGSHLRNAVGKYDDISRKIEWISFKLDDIEKSTGDEE